MNDHQRDLVYGYKDGMGLIMDVFTPQENPNRSAVLWVLSQSMRSSLGFEEDARGLLSVSLRDAFKRSTQCLLDAGYAVLAVAHSSTPKYRIDEIIPNIARAVRFVRHRADRFGIDPDRIGIIGDASGT